MTEITIYDRCGHLGIDEPKPTETCKEAPQPLPPTGLTFRDEIETNEEAESIEPLLPPTFKPYKNSDR